MKAGNQRYAVLFSGEEGDSESSFQPMIGRVRMRRFSRTTRPSDSRASSNSWRCIRYLPDAGSAGVPTEGVCRPIHGLSLFFCCLPPISSWGWLGIHGRGLRVGFCALYG